MMVAVIKTHPFWGQSGSPSSGMEPARGLEGSWSHLITFGFTVRGGSLQDVERQLLNPEANEVFV
jgi:hypothetical protein